MKNKALNWIVLIGIMLFISILINIPYFRCDAVTAHDISYHINRIVRIGEELKCHNIPVLIHSNLLNGLGYANSIFYPELFLYIAAVIFDLGINVFTAYKFLLILITFMTMMISYYVGNSITKNKTAGWIFSIIYVTSFYRLTDMFARGAIGEVLAITFIPLVIYGIYNILYEEGDKWFLICFGIFGIVNSHILSYAMIIVLILLMMIINAKSIIKNKNKLMKFVLAGTFSILLSLSFVLPYMEQSLNDTYYYESNSYNYDFMTKYGTSFNELLKITFDNGENYKTVGVLLMISSLSIFLCKKSDIKRFMIELFIISCVLLLFSMNFIPWDKILDVFGFLTIIQFPYRLCILSGALLSIVTSYSIYELLYNKKKVLYIIGSIYCLLVLLFICTINANWGNYDFDKVISQAPTGNSEYSPVELNENEISVYTLTSPQDVIEYTRYGSRITFEYNKTDKMEISIPFTYYKGYKAYIIEENGNKTNLKVEENPIGKHVLVKNDEVINGTVVVEYKMTVCQIIGYLVTYLTMFLLIIYVIYNKKKIDNSDIKN